MHHLAHPPDPTGIIVSNPELGESRLPAQACDGLGGRKGTHWALWDLVSAPRYEGSLNDTRQEIVEDLDRLDDARERDTGGIGLGLAIVRDIIKRHHGTVDLDGCTETRFVVELPLVP